MRHRLFLKLCLIIATGVVALFYMLNILTSHTEDGMSHLALEDRQTLNVWGQQAEALYLAGDELALEHWLSDLQSQENTWAAIASVDIGHVAGDKLKESFYIGYNLGRNVDWKIHLYFDVNPVMQIPFSDTRVSFLIYLPDRMRPGAYWQYTEVIMQIIVPAIVLALLSYLLYLYIMKPLIQLQTATRRVSKGNFDVSAKALMGNRNDEFSELADTFDQMATRIDQQITSQRQLIADLSHELRTPLTRLDIALAQEKNEAHSSDNIKRITRESKHIRKLVEDTLTLAWLENEKPELQQESLELVDLLDVLVDDASYEYPDRHIKCQFPDSAMIEKSSHRAAGQALENILRNALRYTPPDKTVTVSVVENVNDIVINIIDQGPGVPNEYLTTIFKPFFRLDKSREAGSNSFGLGLALAQRQLAAVRANVTAQQASDGGLWMMVSFPKT